MVEHDGQTLQIDISADFRHQMLREKVTQLNALLITHAHADHIFGLDDIRPFNFRQGEIPLYASESTWRMLRQVFHYIFSPSRNYIGGGLPMIKQELIDGPFEVIGLRVTPFPVIHGRLEVTGFRISDGKVDMAFITDCNKIPESSLALLHGLDLLIIDALRYRPHPTHLHLDQTLEYINQLKPRRSLLTHMGHDIMHAVASANLPPGVEIAYDGLQIVL